MPHAVLGPGAAAVAMDRPAVKLGPDFGVEAGTVVADYVPETGRVPITRGAVAAHEVSLQPSLPAVSWRG